MTRTNNGILFALKQDMLIAEGKKSQSAVEELIRDRYEQEKQVIEEEIIVKMETQDEDKVSLFTLKTFIILEILN